jgi:hypothetical protein
VDGLTDLELFLHCWNDPLYIVLFACGVKVEEVTGVNKSVRDIQSEEQNKTWQKHLYLKTHSYKNIDL